VWAYALAWLPIASAVAVAVRRLLDRRFAMDVRQLARVEGSMHAR
jgi:hypothetical protein